jgi:hypothetical protein
MSRARPTAGNVGAPAGQAMGAWLTVTPRRGRLGGSGSVLRAGHHGYAMLVTESP